MDMTLNQFFMDTNVYGNVDYFYNKLHTKGRYFGESMKRSGVCALVQGINQLAIYPIVPFPRYLVRMVSLFHDSTMRQATVLLESLSFDLSLIGPIALGPLVQEKSEDEADNKKRLRAGSEMIFLEKIAATDERVRMIT